MIRQILYNKRVIELCSIAGIMAFFFWMDRSFGILDWVVNELVPSIPGLQQYTMTIAGAGFVGLASYSFIQRVKSRHEELARNTLEKLLLQQDFIDKNTGLSNRIGFKLMLAEFRNSEVNTKKSIIAFEIRNLVSIASIHGAEVARNIESLYSDEITKLSREKDFAARADNGRFYLLVNASSLDEREDRIQQVIDQIRQFADNGIEISGQAMSIHLNIGVLDLTENDKTDTPWDEEQVVQRLDYMLYCSQNKSHDLVASYSDDMEQSLMQRALVESELLTALSNGQIKPYFQPFIDMKTNSIAGVEILARWEHPEAGFISPAMFVMVAEEVGASRDFTKVILKQACRAARDWPKDLKLAFNISPNELRTDQTMDDMFEVLKETGISAEQIEIEITENAFIEEVGEITEAVNKLKKHGIQISIDDFGTGFSNLSHLKMLPFDKIKIDQSFIRDMGSNSESIAIVKNIIALGKSLNLPTVAEGIELSNNRETLLELGCSIGQGYLYAKALQAEDVLPFIQNFNTEIVSLDEVA